MFTNLPAGAFTLEIRASNNAGVWSEEPAALSFRIEPRTWETTWFRALALVAFLLLVWFVFSFRIRQMRRQQRVLEATVAERTEALREANEQLRDYSERLETASMTDPLTALWNRRYLANQLPADLAHLNRERARPGLQDRVMAFALVDIDHFKQVNDRYGHDAGDQVLGQMAALLCEQVRAGDYVVRWGGEEFLVVYRPMPEELVGRVAARIVEAMRQCEFVLDSGDVLELTCSVGAVPYPLLADAPRALDWEQTVALADKALYQVKRVGRDGWTVIRPGERAEPVALARHARRSLDELVESGIVTLETK